MPFTAALEARILAALEAFASEAAAFRVQVKEALKEARGLMKAASPKRPKKPSRRQ